MRCSLASLCFRSILCSFLRVCAMPCVLTPPLVLPQSSIAQDAAVKPAAKVSSTRVTAAKAADATTTANAAATQHAADAPVLRSANAPRTRSQTKGLSMSSVLQTRSEAAVTTRRSMAVSSPLPDIDAIDRENPLAVADYVNDIQSYYKRVEPKFRVAPDYMRNQVGRECGSAHQLAVERPRHSTFPSHLPTSCAPPAPRRPTSTRRCGQSLSTGWRRSTSSSS
jgi:hypothetical protein